MAHVKFTRHLVRFFPTLGSQVEVNGRIIADIIAELDQQYPGLASYIVNERGAVRRHVNIFVGGDLIKDRETLQDPVQENEQIYIFQALSGG